MTFCSKTQDLFNQPPLSWGPSLRFDHAETQISMEPQKMINNANTRPLAKKCAIYIYVLSINYKYICIYDIYI